MELRISTESLYSIDHGQSCRISDGYLIRSRMLTVSNRVRQTHSMGEVATSGKIMVVFRYAEWYQKAVFDDCFIGLLATRY